MSEPVSWGGAALFGRVEVAHELEGFLRLMDGEFPHPLSSRCDLDEFSKKLLRGGVVEGAWIAGELVGVLGGYVNNEKDHEGYISVLVVMPSARGRRISSILLENFLEEARAARMSTVRVFTHRTNEAAFGLYVSHGFEVLGLSAANDYELLRRL